MGGPASGDADENYVGKNPANVADKNPAIANDAEKGHWKGNEVTVEDEWKPPYIPRQSG